MNILLVGGTCSLMNNIILKLRKEGHRVFLLTGDKYKHSKYEKVFERYDFPYDSENLNEVIESVNPDVTILLGAFDTNYLWNGEERETVHFISHMVNILVAYSVVNRGKLIYLSSDEVFSGDYPDDITEGEKFSGYTPGSVVTGRGAVREFPGEPGTGYHGSAAGSSVQHSEG